MSNMAYNLCLCRFQASMLNTTVETVCTYNHLNMPTIVYCHYGMIIPQNISLNFNKADNDLPIFFTNSLVNWKVDSQLLKEPSS